ncbi:CENP-S associating centromere protein X-domain-containing protein [Aspergillus karnatakaensis]|uniref:CENP-X/MHF2 family protein n=1 Tax=Aspergillus karnatakaensis TaxID=1810916 RepID=UPI003CCCB9AC
MPPERQPAQKRRHLPFKPPSRASASNSTTAGPSKPATAKAGTKKTPKINTTTASSSKTKSKTASKGTKPHNASSASSRQRPSPSLERSASASASSRSPSNNSDTRATSPLNSISSDGENSAADANYILAEISHGDTAPDDVLSSDPLIPSKLLTKLVHHHFKNEKTKIAKDANKVVAKYIDVFVREAVARAAFERQEGNNDGGGGGIGDGFLEVEDLEKMGPQLAMDF